MPQNIALSIYWITSIIGTLFIFISDSFIQKIKQSDVSFSVSKEIDALFDILIVLLLINLGLVYLPIFYFTHIIGLYTLIILFIDYFMAMFTLFIFIINMLPKFMKAK